MTKDNEPTTTNPGEMARQTPTQGPPSHEETLKSIHGFSGKPGAAATGDADDSPVSDTNATEAIATVEKMRSRDRLQHVIDNDPRVTVKEAARKRLAALPQ